MSESEDAETKTNELLALESILEPDLFQFFQGSNPSGWIKIPIYLPDDYLLRVKTPEQGQSSSDTLQNDTIPIRHLPPLTLHFTLPEKYPSEEKPIFTLSSNWLDRLSVSLLCCELDKLWKETVGSVVLYEWMTFLNSKGFRTLHEKEYDATWWFMTPNPKDGLPVRYPLKNKLDPRAAFEWTETQVTLPQFLISWDLRERSKEFMKISHRCSICLKERSGMNCVQFECSHVFCTDCVKQFFEINITEGDIHSVKCPQPGCKTLPTQQQIRGIVGEELFTRYDTFLLRRVLESMRDVIHCPRESCNTPVIAESEGKLATCSKCYHRFCCICNMVYHGVEPCRFKAGDHTLVYAKYKNGTEEERTEMIKAYGKKQLDLLIETVQSEDWIKQRSKPCPHCNCPIEKFEGCNKVTCFKCHTAFCWICSSQLNSANPYFHYNDPSSSCYEGLFRNDEQDPRDRDDYEMIDLDEDDDDYEEIENLDTEELDGENEEHEQDGIKEGAVDALVSDKQGDDENPDNDVGASAFFLDDGN